MSSNKNNIKRTILNFALLGESTVGKTQIIRRFYNFEFMSEAIGTIGVDFQIQTYELKNKNKIKIKVWDTAGQERYNMVITQLTQNCQGIILVYDITKRATFLKLDEWYQKLQEKVKNKCPIIIVGNKCDLENYREVKFQEGKSYAEKLNCKFFETSAKTNQNIKLIFDEIINESYEKYKNEFTDNFSLTNSQKRKKFC